MDQLRRAKRLSTTLRLDWPSCSWEWYSWHFGRTQWPLSHRTSTMAKCSLFLNFSLSLSLFPSIYGGIMASSAYGLGRVSIFHACLPGRPSAALFCSLDVLDWYGTDSMTAFVLLRFGMHHIKADLCDCHKKNTGQKSECDAVDTRLRWELSAQLHLGRTDILMVMVCYGTFTIQYWNFILD